MKYPAYPKYKPSSVEWLGEVPEHWEVKNLRYACRFAYGDSLAAEDREDGEVWVYGSNGAVGSHISSNTRQPVIIVGRKGSYGKINYSERAVFAIDTTYFIDQRYTKNDIRWLFYMLGSLGLDTISKDSAVPGLAREDAYDHVLVTPPLPEQRAIADFLDRETAKLDTLVAKKRELIEMLKEKRIALISRTVTRGLPPEAARAAGLDPQPKLKPSGIEWLGEVPEHWEVKKVSRIFEVKGRIGWRGYTIDDLRDEDDGVLVLGATHIDRDGSIILDKATYLSREKYEESPEIKLSGGELLIVKVGATIGKVGMVPLWDKEATVNPNVMLLRRGERDNRFFHYQFLGSTVQSMLGLEKMAGAQEAINQEFVSSLRLLVPPPAEQRAIADYLDRETAKIDQMAAKVEEAIARLQEYRTALITAAVTGKIEVRQSAVKEAA